MPTQKFPAEPNRRDAAREFFLSLIVRVSGFCVRYPQWTVLLGVVAGLATGVYASKNFVVDTDINGLIAPSVPWMRRATEYQNLFPQHGIIVVVDAPTSELSDQAASKLAQALQGRPDRFRAVSQPGGGAFFERNGLLFLPTEQLQRFKDGMARADPLIGTLASDPSLRGVLDTLSLVLTGVRRGETKLDTLATPLTSASNVVEAALANRPTSFSWRAILRSEPESEADRRRFILVEPVLDFSAIQPAHAAVEAIRTAASDLKLADEYQARVRQTGQIPIDDDKFGVIKQNASLNTAITIAAVLVVLWLALHSLRIIFAVALSLAVGLAVSTALALLLVGALNVLSLAFFVLFIGLGVDFGIQFSVRYRAERHDLPDLREALASAARKAGIPLALAAAATAIGFSSFVPTAYRGLSELGEIAGVGMLIAFFTSVTLLPALLAILNPPGEAQALGFAALAPLDRFLERQRVAVVAGTLLVVGLASPLLLNLPFDFNPTHLDSPKPESVATYLDLRRDPHIGTRAIDIISRDIATADQTAQEISTLPAVAQTRTISNFVPDEQDQKLKLIGDLTDAIGPSLNPGELRHPPTDKENVEDLDQTATELTKAIGDNRGPGADAAARLSGLLSRLAKADESARKRVETAIVEPLRFSLGQLRNELRAGPVSLENLPPDLVRDWKTPDGRARIEVLPKGDPDDVATIRNFVTSVLAVDPNATGPAVQIFEAGDTVVRAFIQAGVFALTAIFILLWITLRRIRDVLLTLVPLVVAGVATLELCVVLNLPLNFANIIALPLLLGVGVAFKIYYIMAWRAGKTALLQSTLTRAVLFSGMTNAIAFGSLWLSSHPGTSSMGKLMALALLCTMAAAVLFQPALMGPPRKSSFT